MAAFEILPIEKTVDNSSFEIIPVEEEKKPDSIEAAKDVLKLHGDTLRLTAAGLGGFFPGLVGGAAEGLADVLSGKTGGPGQPTFLEQTRKHQAEIQKTAEQFAMGGAEPHPVAREAAQKGSEIVFWPFTAAGEGWGEIGGAGAKAAAEAAGADPQTVAAAEQAARDVFSIGGEGAALIGAGAAIKGGLNRVKAARQSATEAIQTPVTNVTIRRKEGRLAKAKEELAVATQKGDQQAANVARAKIKDATKVEATPETGAPVEIIPIVQEKQEPPAVEVKPLDSIIEDRVAPPPEATKEVGPGSVVLYRGRERVVQAINEDGTYSLVGHQKPVAEKYLRATDKPDVDVAEIEGLELKLNKAGYTPQEIRKMPIEQKMETLRAIKVNEAVPPDPAILEKQKAVHDRIQADLQLKNIADIETLKKAGYTEDRITTMTDRWIRETAAEVRGERQNAIADVELKLDEFDTIMRELGGKDVRELTDAELDRVTKALADAEPYASEVIEAQRTAYEEAVRQGEEGLTEQDLLDIDLIRKEIAEDQAIRAADDQTITKSIERELSALEAAEKPIDFIKRRQLIEKAVKKVKASQQESMVAEKKGQVTKLKEFTEEMYRATLDEQEAMPQRGRPRRATAEAEDWEARLAEEGMPAELDFMRDLGQLRKGITGSVSTNESQLLKDITRIHTKGKVDADFTYSIGAMWKGTGIEPTLKFDKRTQKEGVIEADTAVRIPLEDNSIESAMFDPPFIAGQPSKMKYAMSERFTGFPNIDSLWDYINKTIIEGYRVLKPGGKLIVKIQDVGIDVGKSTRQNYFTSAEVYNFAVRAGFKPVDKFVSVKENPFLPGGMTGANQKIARKMHSDYWVFEKSEKPFKYPYAGALDLMKDFESAKGMADFSGRISKKLDIVSEALDRMIRGEQLSARAIEGLVKQGIPRKWAMETVEHLVNQRKAFMDAYNTVYSNIPINYIKDARVTLSNAYKWLPERFSDRVIDKDSFINFLKTTEYKTNHPERMHRYGSDPKGAVDQLELFGKVSPDEAAFMRSLIDALGKKANFDLVVADVKNANGYYSFAKNLMVVKEPRVVLHEVGHFTFYNMMSGAERVKFAESVIRQFYKDGKLDREALRTHLGNSNFFESMNLSEIFATEFSNFIAGKTFLKEHASMYERVKAFLSKFLYNLTQAKPVPADRLAIYEAILREANKGPEPVRTRPRAHGSRSIGLFDRSDVIERMPHQVDMMRETGPTFDMLGLQQTYEWMKSVYDRLRRDSNMPGNKIIAEVTGSDPANPHYVRQVEAAADKWLVQQWVQMSSAWAKGTPVEGIEFKAFKADTSAGFFHNNNLTTLGEIERFLKKNKVSNETLTNILRGDKSPATAAETQAVGRVRDWLDFMRDRYKDFLRQEYVRWLPKKEAAALNDIIKGADIAATVQKYKIGSVEVLVDIAKRYKELENWGLDDYLPKVELGSYRIDIKLKDEKGKSYSKTIAVALSQKDAVRKITDWVNENPDYVGDFTIDTSHRGVLNDITSVTTRKQYYSIVNKLGKAIEREVEGLEKGMAAQLAKGVVSKKFAIRPTDKFSEFTLPRRDVLKGEKDIFPVLRKYSRVMEKKMALDPVIHEFKQMKDKLPPNLRDMTENMLEDTKGTYWYADKLADQVIGAVHGRLEAKGFDVGPPPVMSVSRPLAKLRGFQANVKLGYRPINAFVNWASGQGHVWTKVGEKAIYEANALRNTPEGRALLDELGPYMGMSFAEESVGKFTARTEWWKPLGMFQKAEAPNREVAMLANYLVAREQGLSVEAAKDAAIKGNRFQNFVYNISSLPRSMRDPIGKTLLQFKPYLVQEMHFIASLRGPELFRYLTMQLALGGPRGAIMVMKSLPILGGIAAWDEFERWLNTKYPRASRGVAGAAGLDMSAMAAFQFPKSLSDWGGPTMSDMLNFYDQIVVPVQEGSMRYEPEMLAGKAGTIAEKNIPFLRHWSRVWDNVVTGDGYVRDEEGKIRTEDPLYDPRDSIAKRYMAKAGYAARRLAGAETIQESASKVEERIDEREEAILNKQKEAIGAEISKRLSRGEDVPQNLWEAMAELGMKGDAIRARTADRMMTPLQRRLRRRDPAGKIDVLEHDVQFE